MNTRSFLFLLFTFVAAGIAYSALYMPSLANRSQPVYVWERDSGLFAEPRSQSAESRSWREVSFSREFTVGSDAAEQSDAAGSEATFLYGPLQAKVDSRGHLFVVDYGAMVLKEFSPHGEWLQTYGQGEGQGPGEFAVINDLDFTDDHELWVSDDSNGRITVFAASGEVLKTIKTNPTPYRISVHHDGTFTLMLLLGSEHLFERFDDDGNSHSTYGSYLERQQQFPLILDGWMASLDGEGFVYTGLYTSLLGRYEASGETRFLVETIAPTGPPKLVRAKDEDRSWVDRKATTTARSLSVSGDKIHILTAVPDGFRLKGAIDTYSLEDGTYLYTMKVPETCRRVVVTEEAVYTIKPTSVTKWTYSLPPLAPEIQAR